MIGARRNSVSLVASTLQKSNFIRYSLGRTDITDLNGLRTNDCFGSALPPSTTTAQFQMRSLSETELTRCSRSADNCRIADELEFRRRGR
jgi:hypothetical protein